ncbi:MAG: MIP family channel protein [Anaerolineales bacterium]|nr:MIP family channel protein [Anaerolineales bacterium]
MNRYLSEFLGTFALVFVGTGAVVVNDSRGGVLTHVGVSIAFGLIIMVMIYAVGEISGAHFNPAVTVGFAISKRFAWQEVPAYLVSQTLGALLGSLLVRFLLPAHETLGATIPTINTPQAFVMEVILTFLLMFVIINVAIGAKEKGITAGLAIGATVLLCALFAGPVTGASMNPARSLAPALVSGATTSLWIYLTAPFVGAALAILCWQWLRKG